MSYSENEENICPNRNWVLVQWIGSVPEDAYDIVNVSDIVFDDIFKRSDLKIGSAITVRCGKIKSHGFVLRISATVTENTDLLYSELRKLQRNILLENSVNVIKSEDLTPKLKFKKRKLLEDVLKTKNVQHAYSQTDDENIMTRLMQENQKLKADLYEANKVINSMCKDLNTIVQGAQKKMLNQNSDSFNIQEVEETPPKKARKKSPTTPLVEPWEPLFDAVIPEIKKDDMVLIGSGRTAVPTQLYNQINWLSFTAATRKLLMAVFSRDILATHSLTGKPSPAFIGTEMPLKMRLDPTKVNDIVEIVSSKCNVSESMVRSAITTKCADENKMFKKRLVKNEKSENSD